MKGVSQPNKNIDLGLEVIRTLVIEGKLDQPVSAYTQAAACGVSPQRMQQIFETACRKVRIRWKHWNKELGQEIEAEWRKER